MAVKKLNKKEIDEKIERLLKLDQEVKAMSKEIKDIKTSLEAQYELTPDQKETIYGNKTYFEKAPVDLNKSVYDISKLKVYLKAIRGGMKVIKRTETVDIQALNELVKLGKLPQEALDNCRESKWTFKSMFKRIENVATEAVNKVKKSKKAV